MYWTQWCRELDCLGELKPEFDGQLLEGLAGTDAVWVVLIPHSRMD
jgi:hypothetical protein